MSTTKVREALRKLQPASGTMRPTPLVARVAQVSKLTEPEVRAGLLELKELNELDGSFNSQGQPLTLIELRLQAEPVTPQEMAWRAAMADESLSDIDQEALAPLYSKLTDWSPQDMGRLINGLQRLRAEQDGLEGVPRFVISARYLLGSSKLLDTLPSLALRRFGLAGHLPTGRTWHLMMAGPPTPKTVVLVENPVAFEAAVAATADLPVAWMVTYGYGLSMAGEDYGRGLAGAVEAQDYARLVRAGQPPTPAAAFACERLSFWGDLDPEGFRIFYRLQHRLPHLQLSALYQPMLELLEATGGHPLAEATGKQGQKPHDDHPLAVRCGARGIDQESICSPALLRQYANEVMA